MVTIDDFYRGDTKTYSLTVTDANGSAVDISGWHIWITFKTNKDDADVDAILQKDITLPSGGDSANGLATLTLTSTETSIAVGKYFYDIQRVVNPAVDPQDVETIGYGSVKVLQDITITDS